MSAPSPRWLIVFTLVALVVVGSHEMIAGGWRQRAAIGDAVPGFACSAMTVDVPGGSWSRRSHVMRSALHMPATCRADLQRRIRADARFRAVRCNGVDRCWQRNEGDRSYSFAFYSDYTGFRFTRG